ncbi:MAG: helix-turn-helix transcriptional regulator [Eubacterium sp.]|nr:helix-turn-helix transcriptional regulator [Eubacterium sp.]
MLGEQIKRIRLANKLSQVQMARMLGVSKQSVSNWENDNMVPSIGMMRKICDKFSCSADYLLELDEERHLKIETSKLTVEQVAHIQQLVDDLANLNQLSCG